MHWNKKTKEWFLTSNNTTSKKYLWSFPWSLLGEGDHLTPPICPIAIILRVQRNPSSEASNFDPELWPYKTAGLSSGISYIYIRDSL